MTDHDLIILCPLRMEARAVERAVRQSGLTGIDIRCCGIGATAVTRTLSSAGTRPVLLAGLGGGLEPGIEVGRTCLADRVVNEEGCAWIPTTLATSATIGRCTIVGMDRIVEGPSDRMGVRMRTDAAIVDMEAHAVGRWASECGIPWQVLRSVSDASGDTLPAEASGWFTPEGGVRGRRVAFDVVRRPPLLRPVLRLRRTVSESLRSLEGAVCETVEAFNEVLR